MAATMRIGIDTGGTFTDCVYAADGELRVMKVFSSPEDPGRAVLEAVREIAASGSAAVRHGTTVGTNALLERKGARVAFVTTTGFEDTIVIGRQARPNLYDWSWVKEPALAPENMRFGVGERVSAEGQVLRSPDQGELVRLRDAIAAQGAESVAISLLFSFANPVNERLVAAALRSLHIPISVSHEILPEFREYERGSTVLINAYLEPKVRSYVERLDAGLRANNSTLHVMQSSGGIVPASVAARQPVRTILSGPAGGVIGAVKVARAAGFARILTFDMGGTSTDVALVETGRGLRTTTESQILGMPIAVPTLDIHTVGAGGGSQASFDRGGALKVGPESAGADPGPACYGRGEVPTVTDAHLILGRLDAANFLGAGMQLDEDRAREVLRRHKGTLNSEEEFAEGIVRLSDAHMEKALRKISVEQGHDPREFVLVSFGGAGPLHACALARALHIGTVLIPNHPGALSAFGILASDVVRDFSRTVMLSPGDPRIDEHLRDLEEIGRQAMAADGIAGVAVRSLDLQYAGQGYEMGVDWSKEFVSEFHGLHARRYGYSDERRPVEVVNVRVRMIAAADEIPIKQYSVRSGDGRQAVLKEKAVLFDGAWTTSPVYEREQLRAGDRFSGPAVVVEYSATTFLPPASTVAVDEYANLVVTVD